MTANSTPSAGDRPADFYEAMKEHPADGWVVVDFDETLFLRNSTELFLDSARPRFLIAIVLQLLGVLRPWQLFHSGEPNHYRDWMRVLAVMCVAPWTLIFWRKRAAQIVAAFTNKPLLAAIENRRPDRTVIVTFGFRELVAPLLAAINPRLALLEGSSFWSGARLRIEGKAKAIARHWGAESLRNAVAITDSEIDNDLLAAAGKPFLVKWPEARYEQAGLRPLIPFGYLQRASRPGEDGGARDIFANDFPLLLLAFGMASEHFLLATGAILLFLIAFFSAYETGHHEKDQIALKRILRADFSAELGTPGRNFDPRFAWGVAVVVAAVASWLAHDELSWIPPALELHGLAGFFAVWATFLGYLLIVRLLFHWQNISKGGQTVALGVGLQVGRTLGFAAILPITVVGTLLCVTHGISRVVPGLALHGSGTPTARPNYLICLLLLAVMSAAIALGGWTHYFLNWQAAAIFAYVGLRSAKDFLDPGGILPPHARMGQNHGAKTS